jgi:hypothetical protein
VSTPATNRPGRPPMSGPEPRPGRGHPVRGTPEEPRSPLQPPVCSGSRIVLRIKSPQFRGVFTKANHQPHRPAGSGYMPPHPAVKALLGSRQQPMCWLSRLLCRREHRPMSTPAPCRAPTCAVTMTWLQSCQYGAGPARSLRAGSVLHGLSNSPDPRTARLRKCPSSCIS